MSPTTKSTASAAAETPTTAPSHSARTWTSNGGAEPSSAPPGLSTVTSTLVLPFAIASTGSRTDCDAPASRRTSSSRSTRRRSCSGLASSRAVIGTLSSLVSVTGMAPSLAARLTLLGTVTVTAR